jgi:hypothetical protein
MSEQKQSAEPQNQISDLLKEFVSRRNTANMTIFQGILTGYSKTYNKLYFKVNCPQSVKDLLALDEKYKSLDNTPLDVSDENALLLRVKHANLDDDFINKYFKNTCLLKCVSNTYNGDFGTGYYLKILDILVDEPDLDLEKA